MKITYHGIMPNGKFIDFNLKEISKNRQYAVKKLIKRAEKEEFELYRMFQKTNCEVYTNDYLISEHNWSEENDYDGGY